MNKVFFRFFLIIALASFIFGCIRSKPSEWNVLWISIDDVKADHLGCYGYNRRITPSIDRFAEQGVRFERCISQAPWTLPSYASMLTSRYPYELVLSRYYLKHILRETSVAASNDPERMPEMNQHWYARLNQDVPTLAEILKGKGFITAAWTNNQWLSPAMSGLERGFDEYFFTEQPDAYYMPADQTMDRVTGWLRNMEEQGGSAGDVTRSPQKKWFVFVHLMDPHKPWTEHPEFHLGERGFDLYDGELAFTDRVLGRFLDWFSGTEAWSRTMVILNSDHGEGVYQDDKAFIGHGGAVIMDVIRVPLIIRVPGGKRGEVVNSQVRSLDVFPTILDYLDVKLPGGTKGLSLRGFIKGKPPLAFPNTALTMAVMKGPEQIALTTSTHQMIYYPTQGRMVPYQLWDNAWKRDEKSEAAIDLAVQMKMALEEMKQDLNSRTLPGPIPIDERSLRILEGLGYH